MTRKKQGRHLVLLLFLGALILLNGCGGGLPAASWFGVSTGQDTVYLAANTQVVALNLENGTQVWAYPLEPDSKIGPFYAPPLVTDDSVIVGSYSDKGAVYALSRDEGTQQWAVETEAHVLAQPVSVDGGFIVANDNGTVYRISSESQNLLPLMDAKAAVWTEPRIDEADGRAYVSSLDHHLYAIDADSGEQLWAFDAGAAVVGRPALNEGTLYFGALNDKFFALAADTGEELWRFETEGWVWGGPHVDGDTVFFGDLAGNLYALDATDGTQRWRFQAESGIRPTPLVLTGTGEGDLLYFGTRAGDVYALNLEDGTQKWAQSLDGPIYSELVVQDGFLLVAPFNARTQLVALSPESGAVRWVYPPQEE